VLWNASGSVWVVMLMHATNNSSSVSFFSPMFSGLGEPIPGARGGAVRGGDRGGRSGASLAQAQEKQREDGLRGPGSPRLEALRQALCDLN
jgi:hypothetical protein